VPLPGFFDPRYPERVDPDRRRLDSDRAHVFRLRIVLGQVTRTEGEDSAQGLANLLREVGEAFARRANAAAGLIERLAGRGWRLAADGSGGSRVTRPVHGFADRDGRALPEEVTLVKDALPAEVAVDLTELCSSVVEVEGTLHVRMETMDLPARVVGEAIELVYTPREYLATFAPGG
jgi:hypothetical protein